MWGEHGARRVDVEMREGRAVAFVADEGRQAVAPERLAMDSPVLAKAQWFAACTKLPSVRRGPSHHPPP